jgi:hypothetical protein
VPLAGQINIDVLHAIRRSKEEQAATSGKFQRIGCLLLRNFWGIPAGQLKSASYSDLDLAAFITDTNKTLEWAAAGFNSTLQYAIPGSICAQNTTRQSICEAGLAELKQGERYFLWIASG